MTSGGSRRDIDYRGNHLPGGTYARSLFDNQLVRLSDRGGASQRIGDSWSDLVATELEGWVDAHLPMSRPSLSGSRVNAVHRLDTLAGVARRASRVGLKNPDFLLFAKLNGHPLILAVDAKFSIETAKPEQVSADAVRQLFEADPHLIDLLPDPDPDARYADGLFVSPNYSLTHAMFQHRVGHRRMSVAPESVMLVDADARAMFEPIASESLMNQLIALDDPTIPVWESLLAAQYYFRLERAVVGLADESSKPLLGSMDVDHTVDELLALVAERSRGVSSAWDLIVEWDREVDQVRRQRQALHQVIGNPLTGAELRELSDELMDELEMDPRPSRNRVRKALGARFAAEVVDEVGVIMPPVGDFSAVLQQVADVARNVGERYQADIREIVGQILMDLVVDETASDVVSLSTTDQQG